MRLIKVNIVHVYFYNIMIVICLVIIAPVISIAAAAITRIFKAFGSLNTTFGHRNRIENVKELVYI